MQYKILLLCLLAVTAFSAKDSLTVTTANWHRPPVEFIKSGASVGEFSKSTANCANTGNNKTVALSQGKTDGTKTTYTFRVLNLTEAPTLAGSETSFVFDSTTLTTYTSPHAHIDGRVFAAGFKDDSSAKAQLHVLSGFVNGSSLTDKTFTNWTDAVLSNTLTALQFHVVSQDFAIFFWRDAAKSYGIVLNITAGTTGTKFTILETTTSFTCRPHAINATFCYYTDPVATPTIRKVFTVNATTSTVSSPATVYTNVATAPTKTYSINSLAIFKDFVGIIATESVLAAGAATATVNVVMKLSNNTAADAVTLKTDVKNNYDSAQEYFDNEVLLRYSSSDVTNAQTTYYYSRAFLNGTSSLGDTTYLVKGSDHEAIDCQHGTWGPLAYLLYKKDGATPTPAITSVQYGNVLNATHVFGAALKTAFSVVVLAIAAIFTL